MPAIKYLSKVILFSIAPQKVYELCHIKILRLFLFMLHSSIGLKGKVNRHKHARHNGTNIARRKISITWDKKAFIVIKWPETEKDSLVIGVPPHLETKESQILWKMCRRRSHSSLCMLSTDMCHHANTYMYSLVRIIGEIITHTLTKKKRFDYYLPNKFSMCVCAAAEY